jgi:hypothetical protein
MISPSPTQRPPEQTTQPEPKKVEYTPRKRAGETPAALFVKGIFRPVFKGIYYLFQFIRNHKLVTLVMVLFILGSAIGVNYAVTKEWLFSGNDQFNFHIRGSNGGGDQVQNWLYALRDGNVTQLSLLDKNISQPPDPQQLVNQFSQKNAHLTWKTITVLSVFQESDTTIDSFVEVDLSATGPGGSVSAYMIWHFVTVSQNGGILVNVNNVDFRPSL